jgi:hypothetical protein
MAAGRIRVIRSRRFVAVAASAVTLAAVAGGLTIQAAAGAPSKPKSSGNRIAGTWEVTVNRPAPLPPLRSLQVLTVGGGMVETSAEPPATRSPQLGTWERIRGRLYVVTGVHFRFNPQTGAFLGTQKINSTRRLSQNGQSFTAIARVTVFDPDGNVVGTFTATASGKRMQVERIPDQP